MPSDIGGLPTGRRGRRLVGSFEMGAGAGTSMLVSGLDLAADEFYEIEYYCAGTAAAAAYDFLWLNGDYVQANYRCQTMQTYNSLMTTVGAAAGFYQCYNYGAAYYRQANLDLRLDGSGRPWLKGQMMEMWTGTGGIDHLVFMGRYTPIANVTSIEILNQTVGGIGPGSWLRVYAY